MGVLAQPSSCTGSCSKQLICEQGQASILHCCLTLVLAQGCVQSCAKQPCAVFLHKAPIVYSHSSEHTGHLQPSHATDTAQHACLHARCGLLLWPTFDFVKQLHAMFADVMENTIRDDHVQVSCATQLAPCPSPAPFPNFWPPVSSRMTEHRQKDGQTSRRTDTQTEREAGRADRRTDSETAP